MEPIRSCARGRCRLKDMGRINYGSTNGKLGGVWSERALVPARSMFAGHRVIYRAKALVDLSGSLACRGRQREKEICAPLGPCSSFWPFSQQEGKTVVTMRLVRHNKKPCHRHCSSNSAPRIRTAPVQFRGPVQYNSPQRGPTTSPLELAAIKKLTASKHSATPSGCFTALVVTALPP